MLTETIAFAYLGTAVVFGVLGWRLHSSPGYLLGLSLATILFLPHVIVQIGQYSPHVGITQSAVVLNSTSCLIIGAWLRLFWNGSIRFNLLLTLPVLYLFVARVAIWTGNANVQWSAIAQVALVLLAVCVFVDIGKRISSNPKQLEVVASCLLAISGIELAVCLLQFAGVDTPLYSTSLITDLTTEGRVHGTTDHPATLGKLAIPVLALAMALSLSSQRRTRSLAFYAQLLLVISIALTESRANFIAVFLMYAIWIFIERRLSATIRVTTITIGVLILLVFWTRYAERFRVDPAGGQRPRLWRTGVREYAENRFFGVGINSYVEVAGRTDPLVAEGWPVHNSYLLALAELGTVGVVFVFGGLVVFLVRVARARMSSSSSSQARTCANAILSLVPALATIGWTGWGLIAGLVPMMIAIVAATLYGMMSIGVGRSGEPHHPMRELAPTGRWRQ